MLVHIAQGTCSFCGKDRRIVKALICARETAVIVGPRVYICESCVAGGAA